MCRELRFNRDAIEKYKAKCIVVASGEIQEKIYQEAFDFYRFNTFSHLFTDGRYDFSYQHDDSELEESIEQYEAFNRKNAKSNDTELQLLLEIAKKAYTHSSLEKVLEYLKKAENSATNMKNKHALAVAKGNIGNIYSDKGDLDTALSYFNEALEIPNKHGFTVSAP